jgi:hypothetical protein
MHILMSEVTTEGWQSFDIVVKDSRSEKVPGVYAYETITEDHIHT